jgi:hypothetical protein
MVLDHCIEPRKVFICLPLHRPLHPDEIDPKENDADEV